MPLKPRKNPSGDGAGCAKITSGVGLPTGERNVELVCNLILNLIFFVCLLEETPN